MSLQERLAAAEDERRRAAGLPPLRREPARPHRLDQLRSSPDTAPRLDLTGSSPVLDLRERMPEQVEPAPVTVLHPAGDDRIVCPVCGGESRLDVTDVVGGVDHYTCLACAHLFEVQRPR
ncbi:hypothetical protein [Rhabdothermincola sediminis]|uniref:hypothetical protein n=1 Tax=Rhabdothermincola sediminis TaxID=2751370 RepID=UPI001AA01D65|nr:hypothetical protein [Rhabdothermincola sediminis]